MPIHARPATPSAPPARRAVVAVALAVSLAAAASGCGGGSKEAAPTTTAKPVVVPTTAAPKPGGPVFPLTGLPVDDAARAARPALVVKVDNAPQARPQDGLDLADVVYEEVVEGGITRFLAVFQSRDAESVGPVRSVRPIDPAIVTPLGGLFAYSGGAPKFQRMIRQAPVVDVGFDNQSSAYHRQRGRKAPHNLMTSTPALWSRARLDRVPPRLFDYVGPGEVIGGPNERPLGGFGVVLGERTSAGWDWDAGTKVWRRTTNGTPHVDGAGRQLGFENVVLQVVDYRYTGDVDVAGFKVPEADIIGQGRAFFLAAGKLVPGRWSKPSAAAPTEFADEVGRPMKLTPGRTWVEFMPSNAVTQTR